MKASYSRSVNMGIVVALQQHRRRPSSPRRAALSKTGHARQEGENLKSSGTAEDCNSGLSGKISSLVEWKNNIYHRHSLIIL